TCPHCVSDLFPYTTLFRSWDAYLRFNEEEPSEELARRNWDRIIDDSSPLHALVAEDEKGGIIGIANFVIHESPWTIGPVCYLSRSEEHTSELQSRENLVCR